MKCPLLRAIVAASASVALASTPVLAQQTLQLDNATPVVTIPLESSTSVEFSADGHVHASCQLDGAGTCIGLPPTSCPAPPGVSLIAGDFSDPADGNGDYPPDTVLTLYPTITGADNCRRIVGSGTPDDTGWEGMVGDALDEPVVVRLPGASTVHSFSLKCFGDGGSQSSAVISLRTSSGVPASCASLPTVPGFVRDMTYDELIDLRSSSGVRIQRFPRTDRLGQLVIPTGRWASLRFKVPRDAAAFNGLVRRIAWLENPAEADLARTYVSVSQCPGDFRVPPSQAAPVDDTTFAPGCRNLRPQGMVIGINYDPQPTAQPSTNSFCKLKFGETYYFNMILANPLDGGGITPGESSCRNPNATECGIQMMAN